MSDGPEQESKFKRKSCSLSDYLYAPIKMPKPYPPKLYDIYGRGASPNSSVLDSRSKEACYAWEAKCESIDRFNYKMEKEQKDKAVEWSTPEKPEEKYESMESRLERLGYYKPKKYVPDED